MRADEDIMADERSGGFKQIQNAMSEILSSFGDIQTFTGLFALERAFHCRTVNISLLLHSVVSELKTLSLRYTNHVETDVVLTDKIAEEELQNVLISLLKMLSDVTNHSFPINITTLTIGDCLEIKLKIPPFKCTDHGKAESFYQLLSVDSKLKREYLTLESSIHVMGGQLKWHAENNPTDLLVLQLPIEVF